MTSRPEHLAWIRGSALAVLATACQAGTHEPPPSERTPSAALDSSKLSPALIEKSEQILGEHAEASVGSEYAFSLDGERYVARIELHDDAVKGRHKGVTLYRGD